MDKDLIKKRLKSLPHRKDTIAGMYNYCDYWCERCMFTSRCANYQIGKELSDNTDEKDITNKEFWENPLGIVNTQKGTAKTLPGSALF